MSRDTEPLTPASRPSSPVIVGEVVRIYSPLNLSPYVPARSTSRTASYHGSEAVSVAAKTLTPDSPEAPSPSPPRPQQRRRGAVIAARPRTGSDLSPNSRIDYFVELSRRVNK